MSDNNSGMSAIVALVAIIVIGGVGFFAVQMMSEQSADSNTIQVDLVPDGEGNN